MANDEPPGAPAKGNDAAAGYAGGRRMSHQDRGLGRGPFMQEGFRTMTKTKLTRTFLAACSAVALSAAVYGCGGGGGAPPVEPKPPLAVDFSGVAPGWTVEAGIYRIEAGATLTVGDVTFSCASGDAGCTVTVAEDGKATYAAEGGAVTAASSPLHGQRAAATAAVDAAASAVDGLSAASTDAALAAAQAALDAAKAALAAVTLLPASEFRALQDRIAAAGTSLNAVRAAVADRKAHQSQLSAATAAVGAAETAVNALSVDSTGTEVAAAEQAIADAKAAVAAGTLLTPGETEVLNGAIALAETSLGAAKTAIAERKTHNGQLGAVQTAVAAAEAAVDALDMTSTDEAIAKAQALIEAAAKAVSDGTLLTDEEKGAASATITASRTSLESVTVEARIHAANGAIEGLTATSTDAEVDAAQAAISAATAALRKVQLLTGPQVIAFQDHIDAAEDALAAKRTQIADSKTHQQQLTALTGAIAAAKAAVDALDRTSTDADIDAAQALIDDAEARVGAGTKLTVEEKAAANAQITASMTALEYVTVEAKVYAARTAVDGLTAASTDADVAAAQAAIDAADAALDKVTLLTAKQALAFRDGIDGAGADLETVKTQIADGKEHGRQLKAVNDAVDAASTAVSALSAGSTEADADAAAGKIQAAKDALAAATALTAEEKAAASKTITAAEGTLVTRRAAIVARRDDAKAMSAALTPTPGTTFDPTNDAAHVVDGGEVSGTDNYERSATDTAPAIAGWAGSVHEVVTMAVDGTAAIETDTVVVYTDKAASKSARYTTYYASAANSAPAPGVGQSAGFSWVAWNPVVAGVSSDNKGVIDFSKGQSVSADDVARLFGSNSFPARGYTRTYPDGDSGVDGIQVAFAGSFHGVAGRFECSASGSGDTCTAAMTNDGALTLAGTNAEWSFVPTSTNVSVAGAQEDADYLDFGYWVNWDADGGTGSTPAYTVEAFFKGKAPHTGVDSVVGTASYGGKAAGLYARQVYEGNTLLDDRSGRFTADVALRAYFGGGTVTPDNRNSIGGTISNFMDGGQAIDSGWSVTLNKIGGSTGGTGSFNSDGTFTEGTTAGGGAAGTWSGAFYGDDTADSSVTPQPGSVAGEFTAGFHNGAVVGAFGARKQ